MKPLGLARQDQASNAYPAHHPSASNCLQGARETEYPPVPLPELYHITVQVLQTNTVAPLWKCGERVQLFEKEQTLGKPVRNSESKRQQRLTLVLHRLHPHQEVNTTSPSDPWAYLLSSPHPRETLTQ